eukprot:COSAG01_NODE_44642_length_417_cov_0.597484_2_plen_53_part_01
MESYGLNYSISHGNQSNRDILELNKQIKKQNNDLILSHQQDIVKANTKVAQYD